MNTPTQIINNIRSLVIWPVFAGLVIIMVMYAGILFVTSSGDPSKITRAKQAVLWAAIGGAIGIVAYVAVGFLKTILGVA
jgi:hypothetical protein